MPLTLEQIAEEAMHLSPTSRAELAEKLVESLDFSPNDEVQSAWTAEALRRRDEFRAGDVTAISGEDVLAEARKMVGR